MTVELLFEELVAKMRSSLGVPITAPEILCCVTNVSVAVSHSMMPPDGEHSKYTLQDKRDSNLEIYVDNTCTLSTIFAFCNLQRRQLQ